MASERVIGKCRSSVNGSEFLKFLKTLAARSRTMQLHVILDNSSTHTTHVLGV